MSKKRKKYDSAFKLEAIRLVNEEHRSVSEVERNLDISRGTLARWVREHNADPKESFPGTQREKTSFPLRIRAITEKPIYTRRRSL